MHKRCGLCRSYSVAHYTPLAGHCKGAKKVPGTRYRALVLEIGAVFLCTEIIPLEFRQQFVLSGVEQ